MMLRDASGGGGAPARSRVRVPGRVWHEPQAKPIPNEPGFVLTAAAVSIGRFTSGGVKKLGDDDRRDVTVNAARRALYRMCHGRKRLDGTKSGQIACAFSEIIYAFGLADLFQKSGRPPAYGSPQWPEYEKRNRTQAQRVCGYLADAGIVRVAGVTDNHNKDWRTEVELLELVDVDQARVADVKKRHQRARWERRRRSADRRGVKRDLRVIKIAARALSKPEKQRLHKDFHASSRARRGNGKDLWHLREASRPLAAKPSAPWEETSTENSNLNRRRGHAPGIRPLRGGRSVHRQRGHAANAPDQSWPAVDDVTEGEGHSTSAAANAGGGQDLPRGGRAGGLHSSPQLSGPAGHLAMLTAQIAAMAPTSLQLNAPVAAAIVAAWWQTCRGVPSKTVVVADATTEAIDAVASLRMHAARYERLLDHRPAGWPTSGAAAMLRHAANTGHPFGTLEASRAFEQLLRFMAADQRAGGHVISPLGYDGPPIVPAGYEGVTTMRRRLTEQLAAAGDSIEAYGTLRAAEQAALDHELAGRLPAGHEPHWDLPWARPELDVARWPQPSAQLRWRREHLPLSPIVSLPPTHADRLAEPEFYAEAIATVAAAPRGARLSARLLEALVHAFHAERYGVDGAIAKPGWRPRCKRDVIAAVVSAWESLPVELLPPGWPTSGVGALLHLATWRDPGSTTLDGHRLEMIRPEHLPMAVGRLKAIIKEIQHSAERGTRIERARRRGGQPRLSRRRREAAEQTAAAAHRAAHPPKFAFRSPASAGELPLIAEGPRETYQRIRRQLLLCGEHPADYPSLEEAELALIDLENGGQLPAGAGPSPSACRQQRLDRASGPTTVAAAEWQHLAAAAADMLSAGDGARLAELEAVCIHDGRLVLTADGETSAWAKRIALPRLLEHVALEQGLAHSIAFIAPEHASAFRPSAELVGPADYRAARGDRYLVERTTRYAVGPQARTVTVEAMPNTKPARGRSQTANEGPFA